MGRRERERKREKMNFAALIETDESWVGTISRIVLGAVIFPHGAQKLLGWFGGYGFAGTMNFFTGALHIPTLLAFLVILIESVGALALLAGLGTRVMAAGTAAVMLGAVALVHKPYGFFMNW